LVFYQGLAASLKLIKRRAPYRNVRLSGVKVSGFGLSSSAWVVAVSFFGLLQASVASLQSGFCCCSVCSVRLAGQGGGKLIRAASFGLPSSASVGTVSFLGCSGLSLHVYSLAFVGALVASFPLRFGRLALPANSAVCFSAEVSCPACWGWRLGWVCFRFVS